MKIKLKNTFEKRPKISKHKNFVYQAETLGELLKSF